jgi:PAS domain S-box-containing protein
MEQMMNAPDPPASTQYDIEHLRARFSAMIESIDDAFFAVDRDWRVIYANRKAGDFVGLDSEANIGRHLLDVAPDLVGTALLEHYRDAMAGGRAAVYETCWAPTGAWLEVRTYPTDDGLSVYFHDITEQRQAADALRKSEQRFRNLFQLAGDSIVIADGRMRVVAVNGRACAHFGYAEDEFVGLPVRALDGGLVYDAGLIAALRRGETRLLRIIQRRKDGTSFPAEVNVSHFEDGGEPFFQAVVRDLSVREEAERQLRESERRFRDVIEMTPSGYVRAGGDGLILDVNPALCAMSGQPRDRLIGRALAELFEVTPWSGHALEADGATTVRCAEARLRHAGGAEVHVLFNGSVRVDDSGRLACVTGLMTDISARKQAERRLRQLATHDSLTGLPNRSLLHERVERMLGECPPGAEVAVLFLDLDRFKEVNDSFGHELGDVLLCEVAARLRALPGAADVVARLGGDEFVVAAPCGGGIDAAALAARCWTYWASRCAWAARK